MEEETKVERKKYWLKLDKDFLKSPQMKVIRNMPNGKDYIIFYLSLMLESVETVGHLRFTSLVPYNADMLASVTDTNVDIVKNAIKIFCELGMMQIFDDGTIFMTEVPKITGKECESAERVRKYRLKQQEENKKMLQCNDDVTKCNDYIEEEKEKDKQTTINNKKQDLKELIEKNEYFSTNENLKETLEQWLDYKKERKEYYKEIGFKSLLTQIQKASEEYGQDKVIDLINECMASLYKGILFDKLKQEKERQQPKPSARELRDKEFERKVAEGYFDDVM